jgi:MFS family permease
MMSVSTARTEWRQHWTLPLAAAFGYATAVLHTYGIGAFFEPVQQEFGWSRGFTSGGLTLAGVVAAIFSIPIGLLVDRLGPRPIALVGVVLMTAAFALLGTATGTTVNWFVLWGFIAFANLWLQSTVWTSAVATRFESSRGLAFAITLSGASISQMMLPILATWLVASYGWRTGFVAVGAIWFALVFPTLFLFFRGARDVGSTPRAETTPVEVQPGLSVSEGLRSPAFYQLLLASGLFAFTAIGTIVHFVPILKESGASPAGAAAIAGLVGIFSLIGRLGTGFLLDRFAGHVVGAMVFTLPIIAAALLLYDGADPTSQAVAAAIFGLTVGGEVDVIGYLASRHFGLKNFGVLFGALVGALALGVAFGPLAAGVAYDWYDRYAEFLVLTMICMAVGTVALATLGRPRFGAKASSTL